MQPGWAPYRYGHWAWVNPWGWTWVDDAPWGYAPFHYGRWVFVGGAWGWVPGPVVGRKWRPVYSPALVAWAGGPSFGVSIGIGAGPAVGWFALGPRRSLRSRVPLQSRVHRTRQRDEYRDREPGGVRQRRGSQCRVRESRLDDCGRGRSHGGRPSDWSGGGGRAPRSGRASPGRRSSRGGSGARRGIGWTRGSSCCPAGGGGESNRGDPSRPASAAHCIRA